MGTGSRRRSPLPRNWTLLRRAVLERDGYRCTWLEHGDRCMAYATDVDHIGHHADHRLSNLRALCAGHHRYKTSSDAGKLSSGRFRPNKRPPRRHPGMIKSIDQ